MLNKSLIHYVSRTTILGLEGRINIFGGSGIVHIW